MTAGSILLAQMYMSPNVEDKLALWTGANSRCASRPSAPPIVQLRHGACPICLEVNLGVAYVTTETPTHGICPHHARTPTQV